MCVAERSEAQTVTNTQQPKLEQKTFRWGYFMVFEKGPVRVTQGQSSMWQTPKTGQSSMFNVGRSKFNVPQVNVQFNSIQFAVQFNATLDEVIQLD